MPIRKLREFLDQNNIKYVTITHSPAYTAQEIAASAHIPGREMAKTVVVKIDDTMAMVVLPANAQINLDFLKCITGAQRVSLASEEEFKDKFPDSEIGAMPPFGNLYGMQVFVSEALSREKEIAFNAGSHSELIKMSYKDFERIVKPRVIVTS
ncbi:MAG: YbaK/EbsC family protein [bacterium]|nr:YbaK/EbsC family protein [bacterium]